MPLTARVYALARNKSRWGIVHLLAQMATGLEQRRGCVDLTLPQHVIA